MWRVGWACSVVHAYIGGSGQRVHECTAGGAHRHRATTLGACMRAGSKAGCACMHRGEAGSSPQRRAHACGGKAKLKAPCKAGSMRKNMPERLGRHWGTLNTTIEHSCAEYDGQQGTYHRIAWGCLKTPVWFACRQCRLKRARHGCGVPAGCPWA